MLLYLQEIKVEKALVKNEENKMSKAPCP